MDDLGIRLKEAREARGVPLKTIATRTKISVAALEALERNDFTRLPGGIFGRAFVRAYALEIGLDPETTVADFQKHLERSEREAAERGQIQAEITEDDREFLARQQRAVRWLRNGGIVLVILLVAGATWQVRSMWRRAAAKSAAASASVDTARPEAPETSAQPAASPTPSPVAAPATEPVEPPAAASAPGLLVEFTLTADCWVVTSVDGGTSESQLLRAGESRRLGATREVFLDLGNAGAVQLKINGTAAKPLGGNGVHVQKTITVENAKDFLP